MEEKWGRFQATTANSKKKRKNQLGELDEGGTNNVKRK